MVDDRITDGKRIAQLLSSEFVGLETGPLDAVSVIDADPDVTPAPDGAVAYRVSYRDRIVAQVVCYPDRAVLEAVESADWLAPEDRPVVMRDGTDVKRAVDALRSGLAAADE